MLRSSLDITLVVKAPQLSMANEVELKLNLKCLDHSKYVRLILFALDLAKRINI